jgi:feruloyl esterase
LAWLSGGVFALVLPALAQNGAQFKDWKASLNDGLLIKPKLECNTLISLTGYAFSIETAALVPEAEETPEFCHITGQIQPEIRFEVSLPSSWNSRFYMFGNGGYAGESLTSPARIRTRNEALRRGFAVAQTNTGHDAAVEPLGSFAINRQKLLDYAFRAVHVTAETSKQFIGSYYGRPARWSYFDGCSTGGRQGLMSAQRFPDDFDGIVVGAPVLDFSGTMVSYVWNSRALEAAPLPPEKLRIVARHVYDKCDATDGQTDGLIADPRSCGFVPGKDLPVCGGEAGEPDCLTKAQIGMLEAIYGGAKSEGKKLFWGQPVGAEIEMPAPDGPQSGWNRWIVASTGRTISAAFSETFFRYLAFAKPDPTYDVKSFNFESDLARLGPISSILDAKNPDLSRFRARGGKIVMYFGWADTALNPLMGVDYYERVRALSGPATVDYFRLFMVPGMAHCRGGIGTDQFDALTALVEWVERGRAPDSIIASGKNPATGKARTRRLCPYPKVAKHSGQGSPDDAASFVCIEP